jgi:hypothetical protein
LGEKKGKVIRDWIINWIQTKFINGVMSELDVPKSVVIVVNIANNLDKIGFVQILISKLGVYKFVAYLIYFAFLA